uniref:Low density lipoprotein receptor adaptor protein 1b n=1 Tax=Cyprinus carpio carpio TaxID=630221 RepID=A0A8C1EV23_CYPCA
MDALKSAGRAIIRSPSLAKQSWTSGKHKKLPENWTDTRETLLEGMVFQLKYLGMTLVEEPKGEELSAAAVKRIVATAKAGGKKLQKVTLKVSPRGIILYDSVSNQLIENVSIYRISYCTADKMHDKVFAYIAQSQRNETLECHAYLCTKRKVVSVCSYETLPKCGVDTSLPFSPSVSGSGEVATGDLLDLETGVKDHSGQDATHPAQNVSTENNNTVWVRTHTHTHTHTRILAESRTNPQMLDIGVNPQDYNPEECLSPSNWDKADAEAADAEDAFGF